MKVDDRRECCGKGFDNVESLEKGGEVWGGGNFFRKFPRPFQF